MSLFEGKKILLISPQEWDHIPVSKHHYAKELIELGATVYFLEPPIHSGFGKKLLRRKIQDNLYAIRIILPGIGRLKFHIPRLYFFFLEKGIKRLIRMLGPFDIVWNFDNGNYFKWPGKFGDAIKIFHPVDKVNSFWNIQDYDIVFSVSEEILNSVNHTQKFFVQHGLSRDFTNIQTDVTSDNKGSGRRVGYMGNILHPSFNLNWFKRLTSDLPQMEFNVWGTSGHSDSQLFEIRNRENVIFHGVLTGKELFENLRQMDALLLMYKESTIYKMDNSHKLIEYLSTGRPVISTPLSYYKNLDLFSQSMEYGQYKQHLLDALDLDPGYTNMKGVEYALEHTYTKQIQRIEKCLLDL